MSWMAIESPENIPFSAIIALGGKYVWVLIFVVHDLSIGRWNFVKSIVGVACQVK